MLPGWLLLVNDVHVLLNHHYNGGHDHHNEPGCLVCDKRAANKRLVDLIGELREEHCLVSHAHYKCEQGHCCADCAVCTGEGPCTTIRILDRHEQEQDQ